MTSALSKNLITIVLPVYNRQDLVVRTLDSIAAQNYRPLSLIVVDNNSTDNSLKVVNEWANKHQQPDFDIQVLSEPKPGAANARQTGVDHVTTPWVLHFDSDDSMRPDHIKRIINGIEANPDADILGWDVLTHSLDNRIKRDKFYQNQALVNHLFHSSLASLRYAIRTDLLRQCGGWETDMRGWDDYVLGVKILLSNPKLIKLGNEITVDVFTQTESVSGSSFSQKAGEWESALSRCEKLINEAGRKDLLRWIVARRAIVAGHYAAEGNQLGIDELEAICADVSTYKRWALRRIFNHVARRRRGTAWLCRILLAYSK